MDTVHLGPFWFPGAGVPGVRDTGWWEVPGSVEWKGVNAVIWQIFWLILALGALVMLIPVARQVFKRSDDD